MLIIVIANHIFKICVLSNLFIIFFLFFFYRFIFYRWLEYNLERNIYKSLLCPCYIDN